ncbi:hypothetical protein CEXT_657811 [Caerostris extrusa]|uniref:Uncharacterized protein n=1 Tax=Caerostris extrusa TaxID=172846 RepID=A0AAV4WVL1_CAEEX|nr:hypothetical protein CEXT_657811 [Caerostris extrusa]
MTTCPAMQAILEIGGKNLLTKVQITYEVEILMNNDGSSMLYHILIVALKEAVRCTVEDDPSSYYRFCIICIISIKSRLVRCFSCNGANLEQSNVIGYR